MSDPIIYGFGPNLVVGNNKSFDLWVSGENMVKKTGNDPEMFLYAEGHCWTGRIQQLKDSIPPKQIAKVKFTYDKPCAAPPGSPVKPVMVVDGDLVDITVTVENGTGSAEASEHNGGVYNGPE